MKSSIKKPTAAGAIRALAEKHGGITAEIVLQAAAKKSSPLHSHFNWDDSSAARQYRLVQAGELIRRIKVQYEVSENNPLFPRLRSGHQLFQRPSPQKQIPSN